MRAARSAYVIVSVICGLPLALWIFVAVMRGPRWTPIVICLGSLVLGFAWLLAFEVVLDRERLNYRTLLRGRRSIPREGLRIGTFLSGIPRTKDRFPPPTVLRLESSMVNAESIVINLKVFPRHDVVRLLRILEIASAS